MVTKIQAQTLAVNTPVLSTTQKVAGFAKRNKWLLLGTTALLVSGYLLWSFSVKSTAYHIPKGLVSKPFKWDELHPATTMQAVMDRFDLVKKNIDQDDLEKFVKKEFRGSYCAGKNTSALTLYLMLKPERLKLLGGFTSGYATLALSRYIQYADNGQENVVNLMKEAGPRLTRNCTMALHKQGKLTDVYKANSQLRDAVIQTAHHKAFAKVYAQLEDSDKLEAHSRLVSRFLDTSTPCYLNMKALLDKNASIKNGFITPLHSALQNRDAKDLQGIATKVQSLNKLYIHTFDEINCEISKGDYQPLHWVLTAPRCTSDQLYNLHNALPEDEKNRFYSCLTPSQQHEVYKQISFFKAHLANLASTSYRFVKSLSSRIITPLYA